jgi:alpha-D-ribose 1-methylphosphonate 5-triphosphate synthase subunit PhnH
MTASISALEGGFSDPVFDAQATFRAVMDAMAEPGTRRPAKAVAIPPAPLSPTAAALALTLCDQDTALWLDTSLADEPVVAWLRFQTGATIVDDPAQAHFAFVADPASMPRLDAFAQGSQDYPDRSTTLVMIVDALENGVPRADRLAGRFRLAVARQRRAFPARRRSRFRSGRCDCLPATHDAHSRADGGVSHVCCRQGR